MNEKTTTLNIVLDCIKELSETPEKVAPRKDIIERTGLTPHIIKERIDDLLESGQIKRIDRGVYQSVKMFPPARPIFLSALPDGVTIIEVGDTVIHLTPTEEKLMRGMFGGRAFEAVQSKPEPATQVEPADVMTLDDVARLFGVSRKHARDKLVKSPDFPQKIRSSSPRKPLWLRATILEFMAEVPA